MCTMHFVFLPCNVLYSVGKKYTGGRFLENCFYCYSQQIMTVVPKESMIPYNLTQRAPETQNL